MSIVNDVNALNGLENAVKRKSELAMEYEIKVAL
jgi:hypothetical protein